MIVAAPWKHQKVHPTRDAALRKGRTQSPAQCNEVCGTGRGNPLERTFWSAVGWHIVRQKVVHPPSQRVASVGGRGRSCQFRGINEGVGGRGGVQSSMARPTPPHDEYHTPLGTPQQFYMFTIVTATRDYWLVDVVGGLWVIW